MFCLLTSVFLYLGTNELPEGVVADVHFDPKEPEQLRGETALLAPTVLRMAWTFQQVPRNKLFKKNLGVGRQT